MEGVRVTIVSREVTAVEVVSGRVGQAKGTEAGKVPRAQVHGRSYMLTGGGCPPHTSPIPSSACQCLLPGAPRPRLCPKWTVSSSYRHVGPEPAETDGLSWSLRPGICSV